MSIKKPRKLNRLRGYDYSQNGFYFVTICVKGKQEIFGSIKEGEMVLNEFGRIVEKVWLEIAKHYNYVNLDIHVMMPNHIHGIIVIDKPVGTEHCSVPTYGLLSKIIKSFKNVVTKETGISIFQRSFHDHIVRSEKALNNIRNYIFYNPLKWQFDIENKVNSHQDSKKYYENIFIQ